MIETFVLMELARQLTWCSERARLHHHRTKDRVEVDAVLETPDARVVAVEVKTGATSAPRTWRASGTSPSDWAHGWRPGTCSTPGSRTLSFGERLRVLPIDALWRTSLICPSRPVGSRPQRGREVTTAGHPGTQARPGDPQHLQNSVAPCRPGSRGGPVQAPGQTAPDDALLADVAQACPSQAAAAGGVATST